MMWTPVLNNLVVIGRVRAVPRRLGQGGGGTLDRDRDRGCSAGAPPPASSSRPSPSSPRCAPPASAGGPASTGAAADSTRPLRVGRLAGAAGPDQPGRVLGRDPAVHATASTPSSGTRGRRRIHARTTTPMLLWVVPQGIVTVSLVTALHAPDERGPPPTATSPAVRRDVSYALRLQRRGRRPRRLRAVRPRPAG